MLLLDCAAQDLQVSIEGDQTDILWVFGYIEPYEFICIGQTMCYISIIPMDFNTFLKGVQE